MQNFTQFLREQFFHAAPIIVVGVFGLLVIVERLHALLVRFPLLNTHGFFEKVRDLVLSDQVAEAIALCDRYKGKPVAQVVREGLLRAHQPELLIEDGLELAVSEASQKLSKRTGFLATIANVSTLMGLFGTILGLIATFAAISNNGQAQDRVNQLSSGIATAMYATLMGLGVAIPCMLAFSFLMNRTNRLSVEVDQAAVRTLDLIRQRYYAAENDPTKLGSKSA